MKVPVFSFEKLTDVDTQLGPEMKSTGEVLGIGKDLEEALYKGLVAAGCKMAAGGWRRHRHRAGQRQGRRSAMSAVKFHKIGLYALRDRGYGRGAARSIGLPVEHGVQNPRGAMINVDVRCWRAARFSYIISTSAKGRDPASATA